MTPTQVHWSIRVWPNVSLQHGERTATGLVGAAGRGLALAEHPEHRAHGLGDQHHRDGGQRQ
ncbi:hypothetical protein [Nocardioides sp. TF02-7]|uniref:hypothetical protein n=1 Tax=Nocardioides sp. TF02-7 TaxID=2917724 RepID=UPI0031F50D1A